MYSIWIPSHQQINTPSLQLTQAVEAEGAVVEEEADVSRTGRHGAEGVGTAGGQWVRAA